METELIIIRHGETDWNLDLRYQGQTDITLNENGFLQAEQLSDYLSSREINAVYSSDLKRAYNTAEVVASAQKNLQGSDVYTCRELREMNFGNWEGLTYQDISREYPDMFQKWYTDPTSVTPPEGESLVSFRKRIVSAFKKIINEHPGEKVAVVTHGGSIRVLLTSVLEMPLDKYWRLEVHNTSVSIVTFHDGRPVLNLLNSTVHLEGN